MGNARIDYTNRDYESLRAALLAKIPLLTPKWTDFNSSDLGMVLLELFCGLGDMLAYYQDNQAAEAFLPTARQRQNVINLCKLIAYRLDGIHSASTNVQFALDEPLAEDLELPADLLCRAPLEEGAIDFVTVESGLIPAGSRSSSVPVLQGIPKSFEFDSTGFRAQNVYLPYTSIAHGSITMTIADEAWTEVLHFQDSDRDSRHFVVSTDSLDRTTISMGDGIRGKIAPPGDRGVVKCLVSSGPDGNLGAGTITQLMSTVLQQGKPVLLHITNPTPSTGGADPETTDFARKQAPAELKTLWKAVTLEDYKTLVQGFPGVAKAEVLDTNLCANIRYYSVHLAVAPRGGGQPSAYLKEKLMAFLASRKVITVEVRIFDPLYKPVNIDMEVYAWTGESLDLVKSRMRNALEDYFRFENVSFGQSIHYSDLVALADGVRGVSHVRFYTPQQDILLSKGEIPVLGQLQLAMRFAT